MHFWQFGTYMLTFFNTGPVLLVSPELKGMSHNIIPSPLSQKKVTYRSCYETFLPLTQTDTIF